MWRMYEEGEGEGEGQEIRNEKNAEGNWFALLKGSETIYSVDS